MRKSKYTTLLNDTLIFALGNMGSKMLQFVLMPLYTGYMTTSEYGIASLIFTIAQFLIPIITLEIFDAVLRFGLSKEERKENVLLIGTIIVIIDSLISIILIPIFKFYTAISNWRYYLALYVIVSISNSTFMNYLKVKNKNKIYACVSIFQTLILALTSIYTIAVIHIGIEGYLLSNIVALLLSSCIAFVTGQVFADLKRSRFDFQLFKRMLIYSSPLIFSSISWWLISSSDKIMIEFYISAGALGIYTAAAKIPALINIFTSIFQQSWGISAIREMETSNDTHFYSTILRFYQLVVFGAAIVFLSIARTFMHFYVGSAFSESIRYVPLLVVSAVFSAMSTYYGSLYTALKKSINVMLSTVIGAVVNVILNFILIQTIGLMGAVIGTLFAYFIINLIRLIDIRRFVAINFNYVNYLINCMVLLGISMLIICEMDNFCFSLIGILIFVINNNKDLRFLLRILKR